MHKLFNSESLLKLIIWALIYQSVWFICSLLQILIFEAVGAQGDDIAIME